MSVNKAGNTGMRAAGYCLHSSQTPVVRLCKNTILQYKICERGIRQWLRMIKQM